MRRPAASVLLSVLARWGRSALVPTNVPSTAFRTISNVPPKCPNCDEAIVDDAEDSQCFGLRACAPSVCAHRLHITVTSRLTRLDHNLKRGAAHVAVRDHSELPFARTDSGHGQSVQDGPVQAPAGRRKSLTE